MYIEESHINIYYFKILYRVLQEGRQMTVSYDFRQIPTLITNFLKASISSIKDNKFYDQILEH